MVVQMKVIGITGGVGAGKSTVLDYLAQKYGAKIIEADRVGHLVMEPGASAYDPVVKAFGNEILRENLEIDRGKLGNIVFSDAGRLEILNGIIHPKVKEYIVAELEKERAAGSSPIFVIEAALLLEDHYDLICDEIWYIHTEEAVRAKRLKASRGYSEEKIKSIMANQKSPEEFGKECQIVIDNSGSSERTFEQIDRQMKT
ncbi:MAG: dephospho-CoA kinase [Lachnospiraceae bacterium]